MKISLNGVRIPNISILFAEDDILQRKQYQRYLNKVFTTVYEAIDGEEALLIYDKYKPHIVILDIRMPKVNGLEVAAKIRENDKKTKIIVISAFSEKNDLFKAIPLDLVDYLVKPIKIIELQNLLVRTLNEISLDMLETNSNFIQINNNFKYDKNNKKIYFNENEIKLTKNEIKLIEILLQSPDSVIEFDVLFNVIWDDFNYNMTRLRSLVNRLNKKLSYKLICSRYGQGYILNH